MRAMKQRCKDCLTVLLMRGQGACPSRRYPFSVCSGRPHGPMGLNTSTCINSLTGMMISQTPIAWFSGGFSALDSLPSPVHAVMNLCGSPQLHLVLSWEMLRLSCGAVSRILPRCGKMATDAGPTLNLCVCSPSRCGTAAAAFCLLLRN